MKYNLDVQPTLNKVRRDLLELKEFEEESRVRDGGSGFDYVIFEPLGRRDPLLSVRTHHTDPHNDFQHQLKDQFQILGANNPLHMSRGSALDWGGVGHSLIG